MMARLSQILYDTKPKMQMPNNIFPPAPVLLPDIRILLQNSQPTRILPIFRPGTGLFFLIAILLIGILPIELPIKILMILLAGGLFCACFIYFWYLIKNQRSENAQLNQIEDQIALKRYPEAASMLQYMMSTPMRTQPNRLRAMFLLGAVLSRMLRFEDALIPFNSLIQDEELVGPAGVAVKLGRAMAMLHSDHLFDADRAISDLRKTIDRPTEGQEFTYNQSESPVMAALRLVELYRDVKTGHADEAVKLFERDQQLLTSGLGHRVGEAYALVAVAYDRMNQSVRAQDCYSSGTALQPAGDMLNLYPELRVLLGKYQPATPPTFVA